jgi:hypothetical protein
MNRRDPRYAEKLKAMTDANFAMEVYKSGCQINLRLLETVFVAAGRSAGSASSRNTTLQNHGLIESVPGKRGYYQATQAGHKRKKHVTRLDGLTGRRRPQHTNLFT